MVCMCVCDDMYTVVTVLMLVCGGVHIHVWRCAHTCVAVCTYMCGGVRAYVWWCVRAHVWWCVRVYVTMCTRVCDSVYACVDGGM